MADLTARFRLIDEMSDKLAGMAEGGQNALERWEQAGDALEAAFNGAASGTVQAASAVDGVATGRITGAPTTGRTPARHGWRRQRRSASRSCGRS